MHSVLLWHVPSKSPSRLCPFNSEEKNNSGAALAVQHVQVACRHGDPGAAGEGLLGNLLVAQDAQTVPRPPRCHSRCPGRKFNRFEFGVLTEFTPVTYSKNKSKANS